MKPWREVLRTMGTMLPLPRPIIIGQSASQYNSTCYALAKIGVYTALIEPHKLPEGLCNKRAWPLS